jgi:hypothetical protein
LCEAYLKHHEDKQNGVHANASVCVCMREREGEREQNLKTKGALLESHCMYSYGSRTRVNLRHMCERHYYTLRH